MSRNLNYFNLVGVLCLTLLSIFQWKTNRALNLNLIQSQKENRELAIHNQEQEKLLTGYKADLDSFRSNVIALSAAQKSREDSVVQLETELSSLQKDRQELTNNLAEWKKAVEVRDTRLLESSKALQTLGDERNALARKYNDLATKYNALVSTNSPTVPEKP